jgi:hypothetical protein
MCMQGSNTSRTEEAIVVKNNFDKASHFRLRISQSAATGRPYPHLQHPHQLDIDCKAQHTSVFTANNGCPQWGSKSQGAIGHVCKLDRRLVEGREKTLDRQPRKSQNEQKTFVRRKHPHLGEACQWLSSCQAPT